MEVHYLTMPYSVDRPKELPPQVQQLPAAKRKQWVAVWNSAYAACTSKGGKDCEASAFAQANGVIAKQRSERMGLMDKGNFLERFGEWVMALVQRAVDEGAWDGSPTNYADTNAYCSACLIDVNSQAGVKGDKVQANCKLPVKAAGNGAYNRKAVHAAAGALAGGRGGLAKPADVNAADWASALKGAAKKIVTIYGSMDEVAPDSCYRVAGMTPPKSRALDMSRLYQRISENLSELLGNTGGVANAGATDYGMSTYAMPLDLYHASDGMFLILADQGRLYRMDVAIDASDEVSLSNPVEVTQVYTPVPASTTQRQLRVYRAADGTRRWLMIAATAVLNRVGQIDSMALFDSFVANSQQRGMPYLTFWHLGEPLRMGAADYLAREDALYLATGTFEATALAQAAADSLERSTDGWGASIGYVPLAEPVMVEVARDVKVPVYTQGWNDEISLLPDEWAANLFTVTLTREVKVKKEVKEALVKLVGEDLAGQFEQVADTTNRSIEEQGLIVRAAAETAQVTPPAAPAAPVTSSTAQVTPPPVQAAAPPETPAVNTVEIDDEALQAMIAALEQSPLLQTLQTNLAALSAAVQPLQDAQQALTRSLDELAPRLEALEQTEEQRQEQWQADLPPARRSRITYRPREVAAPAAQNGASMADTAQATLNAFKTPSRR